MNRSPTAHPGRSRDIATSYRVLMTGGWRGFASSDLTKEGYSMKTSTMFVLLTLGAANLSTAISNNPPGLCEGQHSHNQRRWQLLNRAR